MNNVKFPSFVDFHEGIRDGTYALFNWKGVRDSVTPKNKSVTEGWGRQIVAY